MKAMFGWVHIAQRRESPGFTRAKKTSGCQKLPGECRLWVMKTPVMAGNIDT